jgi:hypothetical protein
MRKYNCSFALSVLGFAFLIQLLSSNSNQAMAASIIYDVDETAQTLTVVGTITTDGITGVLSTSDILSYNLSITGFGSPFVLASTNPQVTEMVDGNDLTATATALSFNFADSALGGFVIGIDTSLTPNAQVFYVSSGTAIAGFLPTSGAGAFVLAELPPSSGQQGGIDDIDSEEVIGTVSASLATTPLPASLALFAGGLGVMGLFGGRRKRKG